MKREIELFEKSIKPPQSKTLFIWFIQHPHVPFLDYEEYISLFNNFLKDLYLMYSKCKSDYYWFDSQGKLISRKLDGPIVENCIYIDSNQIREMKIDLILN